MIIDEEAYIEHFGVKGMRWGVRKDRSSGDVMDKRPMDKKEVAKKIAIGLGVLTVAVGAAYAGKTLSQNGSLRLRDIKPPTKTVQDATKRTFQPPTSVIYMARGKNVCLTFLKKGDTPDYFSIFDKLGLNRDNSSMEFLQKATDGSGLAAAQFLDPRGRKDFAGRPILHTIVIPSTMASRINSVDDVRSQVWPLLSNTYDAYYEQQRT